MKPKQAKQFIDEKCENKICSALDTISYKKGFYYWEGVRWLIDAFEFMGYQITIKKDNEVKYETKNWGTIEKGN